MRMSSLLDHVHSSVIASNLLLVDEMMRAGRTSLKTDNGMQN